MTYRLFSVRNSAAAVAGYLCLAFTVGCTGDNLADKTLMGTGVGAGVGAIAGGGKGLAIGAGAGAAAGALVGLYGNARQDKKEREAREQYNSQQRPADYQQYSNSDVDEFKQYQEYQEWKKSQQQGGGSK